MRLPALKKVLFSPAAVFLITMTLSAQSSREELAEVSLHNGIMLKEFKQEQLQEKTAITLNKGSIYELLVPLSSHGVEFIVMDGEKIIGSNLHNGKYYTGFFIECQRTGIYNLKINAAENTNIKEKKAWLLLIGRKKPEKELTYREI